jgi:hypothetical protein
LAAIANVAEVANRFRLDVDRAAGVVTQRQHVPSAYGVSVSLRGCSDRCCAKGFQSALKLLINNVGVDLGSG